MGAVTVDQIWLFAGAHALYIGALMLRSVLGRFGVS